MRVFLWYLLLINLAAFVLMGEDKRRSRTGAWRVPERTLLLSAALGGSLGALCGMVSWRHKTKKNKFRLGIPAILAAQVLAAAWLWRTLGRM